MVAFRKAYLEHLVHPKGVKADLNNVIITGSTAIELFAEIFLDEGIQSLWKPQPSLRP